MVIKCFYTTGRVWGTKNNVFTFWHRWLLGWDTRLCRIVGCHSPRISAPSACTSARKQKEDRQHRGTRLCTRKQRSACCPRDPGLEPARVDSSPLWRRTLSAPPFLKLSPRIPSLFSGCWPNTGTEKRTLSCEPWRTTIFHNDLPRPPTGNTIRIFHRFKCPISFLQIRIFWLYPFLISMNKRLLWRQTFANKLLSRNTVAIYEKKWKSIKNTFLVNLR